MIERMYMSATADGRVVAVAVDDAGDHWVIDDGKVIPHGTCRESALATLRMRGGRQSIERATAEALMAGDDARCRALRASAQRVLEAELADPEPPDQPT